MMVLKKVFALALAVTFPLIAAAQTAPADQPAKPAGEQAATPPTPPPAKAAAPAAPKVTVTPYGFVQGSAYFDQNTFATKDYPGQASRPEGQIGGAFLMSARYSRFGVKLALDDGNWTGAKLSGEIEFDFKGGHIPAFTGTPPVATPPTSTAWYNGIMRLRLADVIATWKTPSGSFAILAGQNYGIVNPLFATTITWTADPLFWMAGNAWRRTPQIRATWTGNPEMLGANVAVAMLSPQTNDGSVDFGSGNRSRRPDFEARAGINTKLDAGSAGPVMVAAGVGYLINTRRVDQAAPATGTKDVDGHFLGVDASITSKYLDLKGEWFNQKAAGDTYQTIAPANGASGADLVDKISSDGFWAQAILKPMPIVSLYAGFGQETVNKGDLGDAGRTTAAIRTKSTQLAGGLIFNAGKFWKFGVEGIKTTTTYFDNKEQDAKQIAVSTQLVF